MVEWTLLSSEVEADFSKVVDVSGASATKDLRAIVRFFLHSDCLRDLRQIGWTLPFHNILNIE